MMKKNLTLYMSILLLLSACGQDEAAPAAASPQMPPSVVTLASPEPGEFNQRLQVVGSLAANQSAVLSTELDGVLEKIHVNDGQQVKAGQLLFSIDADMLQAEYKGAQANVQLRQIEKQRLQSLLKRKAVSQYDLDKANTELQTAEANLELVKARLDKTRVTAPFAGKLGIRKANQGSYLKAGDELIELVQLDPMLVDFQVPETALSQLQQQGKIRISIPALNETFDATITAIEPTLNQATRSVKVRAAMANSDGRLRPGLFARIALPLQQHESVLWVPESALFYQGSKKLIMVDNDGKSLRKSVEIAGYEAGRVAIRRGLAAEDKVVTAGHHKMPFDGMPMMTVPPKPPANSDAEAQPAATEDTAE